MLEPVKNFLFQKFWLPIIDETVYYNPYNTAVLAILFGLLILYVIKPAIEKLEVDLDKRFVTGFIPFIVFGGSLRTLKDVNAVETILLETPFIYLILLGTGISLLAISKKLEEMTEKPYHLILAGTGTALFLATLPFYSLEQPQALLTFTAVSITWMVPGYVLLEKFRPSLNRWDFLLPVSAHFLDATSTFTALNFGAEEKHVLGRLFINLLGNWGMFVLKGLVIIPAVLYILENFDGEEKTFYIFIITLLGLGIATRNIIQTLTIS